MRAMGHHRGMTPRLEGFELCKDDASFDKTTADGSTVRKSTLSAAGAALRRRQACALISNFQ